MKEAWTCILALAFGLFVAGAFIIFLGTETVKACWKAFVSGFKDGE
jgi:hypothetical protein